ncbi:hypothetical protein Agub_g3261, partial [Astrephomene gubernaculifera]
MDANTMQFAMEQMRKMPPEQLQAMMRNMPPDMMAQAMAQMNNMKPEDWERAKREMANMDPDTMARQAAQAQAQMAGRTQYVINASNQLKQEGNQLHSRGEYGKAVEKYERAKSNIESLTSQEARDLARACTLNLSSCYLNLKQYDKCLEQCNQVLSGEPDNLKALYRRGQAHMGSGAWLEAAADLERALRLAKETDPSQTQPIRDKLQETKDQISALRAAGKLPAAAAAAAASAPPPPASAAGASSSSSTAAAATSTTPASGKATGGSSGAAAGMDPEMMARASEMMRSNPEMLKQAQEMMRGMSDEQLRGMAQQMGVDVPPEALRGGMGNVDMDLMSKVAQLQAELPPDLRGPEAARNPESMKRVADLLAKKPELAASMGQVLTSMDADKLQEMSRAAGLPPGVTITPEMAKAAAESFQRMSPQEVQAAVQAVSGMPPAAAAAAASAAAASSARESSGAAASTSGREAPGAALPAMDPRVAADMLAAMTPEQLEAMTKMMPGGDKMNLTPEMAKMAAEMMKGMSAEDLQRMQDMALSMRGGLAGSTSNTSGAGERITNDSSSSAPSTSTTVSPSAAPAAAAAPAAGMMPPGGFPSGMAQMAAEMMKNMKPEDIARMQDMMGKMGGGAGVAAAGAAGMPDPASMASMFSNPNMSGMMESAVQMMKSMDPDTLASMMMSSGMCRDRAQAELMARQMGNMSETQMRMMVKAAAAVQSARDKGRRALEWA